MFENDDRLVLSPALLLPPPPPRLISNGLNSLPPSFIDGVNPLGPPREPKSEGVRPEPREKAEESLRYFVGVSSP